MAGLLTGDLAHHGMVESGSFSFSQDKEEGVIQWYLSRKEIEENSPSRKDGIDLKKEAYLRKSYCTFLQDLGMRLKVPQVTIATAIIFCHRFFLHQSHGKNDRRTIATVCMFLAGKVEETPRPLKDVILVSYEIIHKKDPAAVQRIKQKEVYEQQKELILLGERCVLTTLSFDFNVHHPYKPLVEAIKRLKVAQNSLAQVAWNFVNDGLRTSLCLQFKPHHIAAGAIFLAAKFLKVKLPSEGEKVWWKEFDVTSRQLEEVSNQMLELYEQNKIPGSQGSENAGGRANHPPERPVTSNEGSVQVKSHSQVDGVSTTKSGSLNLSSQSGSDQMGLSKEGGSHRNSQSRSSNYGSTKSNNDTLEHSLDDDIKESRRLEQHPVSHTSDKIGEAPSRSKFGSEQRKKDEPERENKRTTVVAPEEQKNGTASSKFGSQGLDNKVPLGLSPEDCIKKISKEKFKAAREKRQKLLGDVAPKKLLDDDDLIERELEDGVELAVEDKKVERESMHNGLDHPNSPDVEISSYKKDRKKIGNGTYLETGQNSRGLHADNIEDGEVSLIHDDEVIRSPKSRGHKRKAESPDGHQDHIPGYRADKGGYVERDHKRHVQESQV